MTAYITFNGYLEAAGATERFEFIDPFLAKVPIFIVFFLYIYFIGFKHYAKSDERHESNMGEGKKKRDEKNKEPLSPEETAWAKSCFSEVQGL